jgi:hypothetical protein
MKLYGVSLDMEMAKRKEIKRLRIAERKTLRKKADEMGMKLFDYVNWESGRDVCPHEEYEKSMGGVHPPFFLMNICTVCGNPEIICALRTEEDFEKHKAEIEEALKNAKRKK